MSEPESDSGWMPPRFAAKAQWMPAAGERPEGMYVAFGGNIGKTVAALRFFGPDLEPALLTEILGCEPTSQHRKGDPIDRTGRGCLRDGSWRVESLLEQTASIDEHVAHLLSRVTADLSVWAKLAEYRPDIFCGLFLTGFNQGDALSPTSARLLAERGVVLTLDIYSRQEDDE